MKRGYVDLPLHYGKAPRWLFSRMKLLAKEIILAMVSELGRSETLIRISNPFWFQALGCLLGFDWHSSGLTTTTCGALKEAAKEIEEETGLFIAGGKGKRAISTPNEIKMKVEKRGLSKISSAKLIKSSRLAAKVDSCALQDGYSLYHHTFIFTEEGEWAVIQQGMREESHTARRYHWLEKNMQSFVCEPHLAILSEKKGKALNLVASESEEARKSLTYLLNEKPEKVEKEISRLKEMSLPKRHELFLSDINPKKMHTVLINTYEIKPQSFEEALLIRGLGSKSLRALALLSELLFGTKVSWKDPARYSFAHGGKDSYPYPVNKKTYDKSIEVLKEAVKESQIGKREKIEALKRLYKFFES
jgi:hypothetical protein